VVEVMEADALKVEAVPREGVERAPIHGDCRPCGRGRSAAGAELRVGGREYSGGGGRRAGGRGGGGGRGDRGLPATLVRPRHPELAGARQGTRDGEEGQREQR
jgi:hypothetical protein